MVPMYHMAAIYLRISFQRKMTEIALYVLVPRRMGNRQSAMNMLSPFTVSDSKQESSLKKIVVEGYRAVGF